VSNEIAVLNRCRSSLMAIKDLSSILEIRDKAKSISKYLEARDGGWKASNRALSVAALAEARAGQEIKRMQDEGELATRGSKNQHTAKSQDATKQLSDLGLTKSDSSRMQLAAEVLESEPTWFDEAVDKLDESDEHFTQQMVIRRGREIRNDRTGKKTFATPRGKYDVIVIDPPWEVTKIEREARPNQVKQFDYETMNENELAELAIPVANDCHVWCWATHKYLPMALRLVASWGLKYVCTFVWHKPGGFQPYGLPQYNCEFALYARNGSPKFTSTKSLPVCFSAARGKHSEKPEEFYDFVRRVTKGKRLDMFNRRKIVGFKGWGNES